MKHALVAAALLLLGACASTPPAPVVPVLPAPPASAMVELDNAVTGTRVTLTRGGELKLLLDASPVNNLQWELVGTIAPTLAPIGTRVHVGKSINIYDLSAGAVNIFRFRGEQAGATTVQLDLRRIDQTGAATRSVRYQVVVE